MEGRKSPGDDIAAIAGVKSRRDTLERVAQALDIDPRN